MDLDLDRCIVHVCTHMSPHLLFYPFRSRSAHDEGMHTYCTATALHCTVSWLQISLAGYYTSILKRRLLTARTAMEMYGGRSRRFLGVYSSHGYMHLRLSALHIPAFLLSLAEFTMVDNAYCTCWSGRDASTPPLYSSTPHPSPFSPLYGDSDGGWETVCASIVSRYPHPSYPSPPMPPPYHHPYTYSNILTSAHHCSQGRPFMDG